MIEFGAHVDAADPVAEARSRGAQLSQFFLGDPQGWKTPAVAYAAGPDALRADAEAAGVGLFVHAPYVLNVASTNNRVRIPSRKLLQQQVSLAARIGARGLVVHGGHVGSDADVDAGFDNWRKCIEGLDLALPLLIENTAGGTGAMARTLERIDRLWSAVAGAVDAGGSGGSAGPAAPGVGPAAGGGGNSGVVSSVMAGSVSTGRDTGSPHGEQRRYAEPVVPPSRACRSRSVP